MSALRSTNHDNEIQTLADRLSRSMPHERPRPNPGHQIPKREEPGSSEEQKWEQSCPGPPDELRVLARSMHPELASALHWDG